MKRCVLFIGVLFVICNASAQSLYDDYDWEQDAKLHELSAEDSELGEVILQEKRGIEFAYGDDGRLYQHTLVHKIIKVNSNEAIEKNNKVYLPLYNVENIAINKARVITSDGKIKELDESDIKEAQDDEGRYSYKYYAIEGIDIGSEIEYFYLLASGSRHSGVYRTFQSDVEKRNVTFEITAPNNLTFTAKSYNGFPKLVEDTLLDEANRYRIKATIDKIEGIDDEEFANYEANLMAVAYKLAKNKYLGGKELFTYNEMAEAYHRVIKGEGISKKERSAAKKLWKKMPIPDGDEETKIRALEEHIKKTYTIKEISLEGLDDITVIAEEKVANSRGILKLMCAIFDNMGIKNEIVMTSNRYSEKFDKGYESYSPLNEIMLYFPSIDKFMAPTELESRLGLVPFAWTNNYGLFIRDISLGDIKTGAGKVKWIKPLKSKATGDESEIEMVFGDFTDSKLKIKRSLYGYYGQTYQFYYDYIDPEQEEKLSKNIVEYVANDAEVEELKIENKGTKAIGVKPLIVSAAFDGSQFIEKAGPKYLFKVGEVIGPQAELYQEKERKLPVENDYNRFYKRTITFTIPEGYEVANLDDLNMDVTCGEEGEETCVFISKYTVSGSKVTVVVDEWYEQVEYPLSEFEAYRKVINAAADFNKIVLIIRKKG